MAAGSACEEGILTSRRSRLRGLQTAITEVGGEIANCGSVEVRRPNSRETVAFAMGRKGATTDDGDATATRAAGAAATSYPPSIRPSIHPQCFAASSIPARPTDRRLAAAVPVARVREGGGGRDRRGRSY